MFGPFVLQWRAPSPNPPRPPPPPAGIKRTYVTTTSGPLELLSAIPDSTSDSKPPLFFAHGGFGCAEMWIPYLQYFSSQGYPCYSISYRGHGNSWYPGLWRMYFTSRGTMGSDLVAGIEHVEKLEKARRKVQENVKVILIAHSAGGALSQYILSRGLVKVQGFCMFAAVPGFGSWSAYKFWALTAPFHFPYRLYHPRYILANTQQVHDAFFSPSTPTSVVKSLERLLSPYESMLWPMQALFRFVTGADVLSSITGWRLQKSNSSASKLSNRFLVIAAEKDVLCTPSLLEDATQRYRAAFRDMVQRKKVDGISERDLDETSGVSFKVVPELGHHLQNHVGWERGAEEVLDWVKSL
ncbi:alpha/beta-hydrolase [Aaosphaeria arxii CBS 175.79]|uniref:Alpha/beta-hydrolase n=1 Tax=Aaosphaeria arxii CBS 175.79 TaxID=1450172 RepID=A0A6A5XAE3_9PLEO|nr:alpha/beta-hydrolase [Aaosphaeria arxii CBS 175.79]KAF2010035.1 alpha/beta-hydrolase [Aaosphaeria arxii CBS 175.79]